MVCVEVELANPKRHVFLVHRFAVAHQGGVDGVEHWMIEVPTVGIGDCGLGLQVAIGSGREIEGLRGGMSLVTALPFGAVRRTRNESFADAADSLVTVLRMWIVAESTMTVGVVTNVPHGTMCVSPVVTRRTCRLIPAPGYQRDAGCCESSTRHRQYILAWAQVRRQFINEAHVAIRPMTEKLPVEIDIAVGHNAVEDDKSAARGGRRGVGGWAP